MCVTTLAKLTFSCQSSSSLTSQQCSTQLNKPVSWERIFSLATASQVTPKSPLLAAQPPYLIPTMSQCPGLSPQPSSFFGPPKSHIFKSLTCRLVMLPHLSSEFQAHVSNHQSISPMLWLICALGVTHQKQKSWFYLYLFINPLFSNSEMTTIFPIVKAKNLDDICNPFQWFIVIN